MPWRDTHALPLLSDSPSKKRRKAWTYNLLESQDFRISSAPLHTSWDPFWWVSLPPYGRAEHKPRSLKAAYELESSSQPIKQTTKCIDKNRAAFIIMRTLVFECQHDNKYTNKASVFRKTTDVGQQICLSSSRFQEPRAKWTCQACKQRRWWYSRVLELFYAIARQECFDKAELSFCKEMLPFGVPSIKRAPLKPGLDTMATILTIATQRSKRSQWSLRSMVSKWSQGSQDGGLHDRSDLWAYGFRTIATIIAIVVPRSLRSHGNQS